MGHAPRTVDGRHYAYEQYDAKVEAIQAIQLDVTLDDIKRYDPEARVPRPMRHPGEQTGTRLLVRPEAGPT